MAATEMRGTPSLSKLFPITALMGSEENGNMQAVTIVGLDQNSDNPEYTDVLYTGDNWSWKDTGHVGMGWGNSVDTKKFQVRFKDMFNLIVEAHKAGEVADLTNKNISEKGLWVPTPVSSAKEPQGMFGRMFG